ncbi:MAG TPA: TlpA disulfide reductase family protein, partial [Burkholderiales bacterium]|jgi:thiol-disulfide isomerase/thioredoxin|nr:TlpA disulfide reductase family protein [Burkholderiales bacterium]
VTRSRQILALVAVAVIAVSAGVGLHLWQLDGQAAAAQSVMALRLPDLRGESQAVAQWRGKVLVVNFWATWCAPCREEIPAFVKLQSKYAARGVQFVGIAIDQPDRVAAFAREFGMNYAILLGGINTVDVTRTAGNTVGALPFTLVLDRDGDVASRQLGKIHEAELDGLLERLLNRS